MRYYLPVQVGFMTLFGTVLAGFYAVAANFKVLGMSRSYKATLFCALCMVPAAMYFFSIVPKTGYDRLFPVLSAACMSLAAYLLQNARLKIAIRHGAAKQTIWRQILVIVGSLVALLFMLGISYIVSKHI